MLNPWIHAECHFSVRGVCPPSPSETLAQRKVGAMPKGLSCSHGCHSTAPAIWLGKIMGRSCIYVFIHVDTAMRLFFPPVGSFILGLNQVRFMHKFSLLFQKLLWFCSCSFYSPRCHPLKKKEHRIYCQIFFSRNMRFSALHSQISPALVKKLNMLFIGSFLSVSYVP